MDNFEKQLKSVALAGPGRDLRDRIFSQQTDRIRFTDFLTRRIPVGWAAVLAISAGLFGMYMSDYLQMKSMEPRVVNVKNFIITNRSQENPFDFTSDDGMGEFMRGELTFTADEPEGI
ncbi:MAG: hypothetical protein ACYSWP_03800 [Planctomycetota bacterium]|jgi:hypothetical protein